MSKGDNKLAYIERVKSLFRSYGKVLLIGINNVTSSQLHQLRYSLKDKAVILMGRNTLIRKAMNMIVEETPQIEVLIPYIKGNVGLIFTNEDLRPIKDIISENKVSAPAKVGTIAQCEVVVPACNTGMSPDKTSFFQALKISTKVTKGAIEILSDVKILNLGDRVGSSEAELLSLLGILPFTYSCCIEKVYENGSVYPAYVLDITEEDILNVYKSCIDTIAGISLSTGYMTLPSVPHVLVNTYKGILELSLGSGYLFEGSKALQNAIDNPVDVVQDQGTKSSVETERLSEKEESEEEDLGLGLFD